ncbi:MAG: sugar phosphate isomerase/epimerase [Lentisphaerae bacterium]|mgnify:FL=1|jgi:sugar phosphate isomerase/epimerase|nr:sugar phosphate isomerase/epimerase [Lentisphaerota bacterium]
MKLGVNSVLFGKHDLETAFKWTKICGYDAIEVSAIDGMSQHLVISKWRELAPSIKALVAKYELPIQAMEQPSQDPAIMEAAFQAAVEIGIPVINCGPGGKMNDESSFQERIDSLGKLADMAGKYGVTLCCKAHVNAAIWNTPTSLRMLEAIKHPNFGLDMDPSHIYRAGENPVDAITAVIDRIKHVHIRDCKGRQSNPGKPEMQANGRGDIDLAGYLRVLRKFDYQGPVDLEIIGAKDYELPNCIAIAAESRGHMQACLQACGAR